MEAAGVAVAVPGAGGSWAMLAVAGRPSTPPRLGRENTAARSGMG